MRPDGQICGRRGVVPCSPEFQAAINTLYLHNAHYVIALLAILPYQITCIRASCYQIGRMIR
jgi:hypothetical protein